MTVTGDWLLSERLSAPLAFIPPLGSLIWMRSEAERYFFVIITAFCALGVLDIRSLVVLAL